jgi:hypothetical protein
MKVDNQMVGVQIQVGNNIVEDVLLDGGASVNIITKNLETKIGISKPKLVMDHLKMVEPEYVTINLKTHIYGIPYVTTFIDLQNSVVDSNYSMLLGRHWFKNAKVTHDWGNNVIIVQGNGTIKTYQLTKN